MGKKNGEKKKKLNLNEFKLLEMYKGMLFYDEDVGEVLAVCESNLEWKKKDKNDRSTPCYAILATPYQNESNAVSGDDRNDDDDDVEPVCYYTHCGAALGPYTIRCPLVHNSWSQQLAGRLVLHTAR